MITNSIVGPFLCISNNVLAFLPLILSLSINCINLFRTTTENPPFPPLLWSIFQDFRDFVDFVVQKSILFCIWSWTEGSVNGVIFRLRSVFRTCCSDVLI